VAERTAKQEELLRLGREWVEEHDNKPPRAADWRNVRGTKWPSYLTVYRAFGSWDAFVRELGFEPRGVGSPGY